MKIQQKAILIQKYLKGFKVFKEIDKDLIEHKKEKMEENMQYFKGKQK